MCCYVLCVCHVFLERVCEERAVNEECIHHSTPPPSNSSNTSSNKYGLSLPIKPYITFKIYLNIVHKIIDTVL